MGILNKGMGYVYCIGLEVRCISPTIIRDREILGPKKSEISDLGAKKTQIYISAIGATQKSMLHITVYGLNC